MLFGDSFTRLHHKLIADLAARYRLPFDCPNRPCEGRRSDGLRPQLRLGSSLRTSSDLCRSHSQGGQTRDLPIQAPTIYKLVINLKTAKALGLTVPLPLLGLADEVIE